MTQRAAQHATVRILTTPNIHIVCGADPFLCGSPCDYAGQRLTKADASKGRHSPSREPGSGSTRQRRQSQMQPGWIAGQMRCGGLGEGEEGEVLG